ncbi:MAG: hypothetical protein KKB51_14770 [Candidatus Riflebacteria bacterium]|nr:hypothetical protein [Candidatus Riflebacteria bacterium]
MKFSLKLLKPLLIVLLIFLPLIQVNAESAALDNRLDSIVITFDPPVINCVNRSEELYHLIINTMRAPENGLLELIEKNGAMWSVSHSLCGVQFSLFHFDDSAIAAQICRNFLTRLHLEMQTELKKEKKTREFADYIHALLQPDVLSSQSSRKPVSINCSANMGKYEIELDAAVSKLLPVYENTTCEVNNHKVLPGILPTVYTVFRWPEISFRTFSTAKFLGEKFIKQAGLDQLLKYEIIYGNSELNLVVYISGNEEQLAENMQKFRQIHNFELSQEPPPDWTQFSDSLCKIMADDLRDLAKKALFTSWLKHWQGSFDSLNVYHPEAPEQRSFGFCMPTDHQHLLSFSSKLFPNFAATSRPDGDDTCDITMAIGGDNQEIINEIHRNFSSNPSAIVPLTMTRDQKLLKIAFNCSSTEVSGHLARLRNNIYNNLAEKLLISEPVGDLKIGIAGISNLPPFELRGLLQRGWSPIPNEQLLAYLPGAAHAARLLDISDGNKETLRQRWQLYLASSRGRSELLATISAAGYQIKDFSLPE